MQTSKEESVNINTIWKVVNGCQRIRRELQEGRTIPPSVLNTLVETIGVTQMDLRELEESDGRSFR